MGHGCFVFTPEPLSLNVMIQDPKAENGKPFMYPDEDIDWIYYWPTISETYEGMFDPVRDVLPKYGCEFCSNRFTYPANWKDDPEWIREWNEASVRALTRLTAFIRKNVKEMGEFWYVSQWSETAPQRPEDINLIEMNVDNLRFAGEGIDSFRFKVDTFYKFTDV
ncbi:MAG: hypothetical protein LBU30_00575 [Candidatus Methanoplasma sp.]|jgi:hypothetical protein|nr:hypothetical protein [Candidatus Methanoplasma sp.]